MLLNYLKPGAKAPLSFMKKKRGGQKGNKNAEKTGTNKKVIWLGLRWFPDELADVLAAIEQEGIKNKSLFVVRATVEAARRLLNTNRSDNDQMERTIDRRDHPGNTNDIPGGQ